MSRAITQPDVERTGERVLSSSDKIVVIIGSGDPTPAEIAAYRRFMDWYTAKLIAEISPRDIESLTQ